MGEGGGFFGGIARGLQQAKDTALQREQAKLQKDFQSARLKQMDTEQQLSQLQIQTFLRKAEAEQRMPSQMAALLGPQGAQLAPGEQGPPTPTEPPLPDRQRIVSLLQSAQQAGQDPDGVLKLMTMADPRIGQLFKQPKVEKLKEGEQLVEVTEGLEGSTAKPIQGAAIPKAPKPVDFGDRLESATAIYTQSVYGKPQTFSELVQADPIAAEKLRQQTLVDEPTAISAARVNTAFELKEDIPLEPEEIGKLGVPMGTTRRQARGLPAISPQQREALAGYDTTRAIIADIKQYSDRVNVAKGGVLGRVQQLGKLWGAWTQADPDAALLQSKAGELASLARALGEKGALATADIARAAALVPGVGDTKDVAVQKIKDLVSIINNGEVNFRKSLGIGAREPVKERQPAKPQAKPMPKVREDLDFLNTLSPLSKTTYEALTPEKQAIFRKAYAAQQEKMRSGR